MTSAAERLSAAAWHDAHLAFAYLGETLWWICVVDEMLKDSPGQVDYLAARHDFPAEAHLKGLRYARNRFAHDGDVLEAVDAGPGPQEYGDEGRWVWRDLPPADRARHGESEYDEVLRGVSVGTTLDIVLPFLRGYARHYVDGLRGGLGTGVIARVERGSPATPRFGRPNLPAYPWAALHLPPQT
jgi:hypothetical protein